MNNIVVHKLPDSFIGTGEVKGFEFSRIAETSGSYVYQVMNEGNSHYEVFHKKQVPVCLNFSERIYSDTEFKEVYPKSKVFGITAWTVNDLSNVHKYLILSEKENSPFE